MTPTPFGIGFIAASVAAGIGATALLWYLSRQRHRSGAAWFMGNMASVAVFCFSYGASLLVFEPALRLAFAVVSFLGVCFMGPFFLAFGLDYTGRGDLIRTPFFGIVAAVPLLTAGLAATNSIHELVWTGFRVDPAFGLATATYAVQPWGIFALLFSIGTAGVGSLLLIGAILSYVPLYRRETTAVILSTAPPTVGVLLWLFEVGPVPQLHLTAPLMLVHVALDAYAFVGTHMFDTNPATQRMAERSGLDSLSDPVLVVDAEEQIVRTNDRAEELFGDALSAGLPVPLAAALEADLATLRESGELSGGAAGSRTFGVSHTPLTDPSGNGVGSMLVLYDVTEERRREQQLMVFNRVLRHNLRNETTVISGYAELLKGVATDPKHATQAGTIADASDRLLSIAEKAREFEQVQERAVHPDEVSVSELLDDVEERVADVDPEAAINRTVTPPDLRIRVDTKLLSMLLANLVENAIVHSAEPGPTVDVSAFVPPEADGKVAFRIRDRNEQIPEMELDALRAAEETSLDHGQGIGLWIVYWCLRRLDGDIGFEYDDGNIVTVTIPDRSR
ncbi:signal transduction histidine kinase [Halorubrum alkaliphilum]|uniref:histidine kinase n=1 Tax=Halorubrum alkaliphilum TaxID=261290 RepID=A0A8T4GF25_9EURY|nr:histidine kinase N-terminal 7TM domain-containing protein [Halorubrum alkaliphilum]MBP1922756.1 signal transduction histidine kinase [Halorubrum alkaliphilum]